MQIDRRITNGLAWAGVVLVVGIPLADLVSGQLMGDRSGSKPAQIAMIEPVQQIAPVPVALSQRPPAPVAKPAIAAAPAAKPMPVAPVAPTQTAAVAPAVVSPSGQGDVVDGFLKSGRKMPAYITDANAAPVAPRTTVSAAPAATAPAATSPAWAPAAVAVAPVGTDPMVTASLSPAKVAPMPMPLSMRPEPVLIVDGPVRTRAIGISSGETPRSSASVTFDDLQDWESGPLSEFLARREGGGRVDPDYDEDGFFLNDGPNAPRRGDRLIGPVDEPFFSFVN